MSSFSAQVEIEIVLDDSPQTYQVIDRRHRSGHRANAAKTEKIGDGKIFVSPIEQNNPHPYR